MFGFSFMFVIVYSRIVVLARFDICLRFVGLGIVFGICGRLVCLVWCFFVYLVS